jgi:uncharacterized protein YndB with AHSA1/START domain
MTDRDETEGTGVGTRDARGRVEIDAPIERVWRALVEARELERWFPLEARVEPGDGGSIWMSWGNEFAAESRIEAWDPPTHLRTSWAWGAGPSQVTDYHLEGEGGRTVLRVVTSGFPADAVWDDLVEGTRLGWQFELGTLKHYLERHAGEDRRVGYVRRRIRLPRQEAWERVMADPYVQSLEGEAVDRTPPWQMVARLAAPGDAIFRFTVDPSHADPDEREAVVFLSAWGATAEEVSAFERAWEERLARLLPEGEAVEPVAG